MTRITLALTGASGMSYGLRLLECLLRAGCQVDLLISQAARVVARQELDIALPAGSAEVAAFFDARFAGHGGRRLPWVASFHLIPCPEQGSCVR